jgi:membrane-bound lytic murein transglycosylase D
VPMVLAAIVIARNPAQYGFSVAPAETANFERVALPGPVDLRRVAEWTGATLDDIQRLNPELRRWTTPVRGTDFALRVPAGTSAVVQQRLQESTPEEQSALQWYTVKPGDTLQSIATKLKVRRTDLADANYLGQRAGVKPGQKLVIPRAPTALPAVRADRPEPASASATSPDTNAPTAVVTAPSAAASLSTPGELVRVSYRVKPGDTLSSIAGRFRTTVAALRSWNSLKSDRITAGEELTVYTPKSAGGLQ